LLGRGVRCHHLGLCVIDEQQRFGVAQRGRLAALGQDPHVLILSATPIPRTLATTLYGDLDLSTLRELPPGRRPVRTVHLPATAWPKVRDRIAREVARGGKVFVVAPRIDDGAVRVHADLARTTPALLVHGRQSLAEQARAEAEFRDGRARVLVGSTVLEVGIDVTDATWMVIAGAERFGLATLHQLRGRIGRGERRALCLLLGEPSERLAALVRHRDGFRLAEEDLRLRGCGDLLGLRQSGQPGSFGLPAFRLLDPTTDLPLLVELREALRAGEPGP
jgi:ATP-dependent DNA helicase RecG